MLFSVTLCIVAVTVSLKMVTQLTRAVDISGSMTESFNNGYVADYLSNVAVNETLSDIATYTDIVPVEDDMSASIYEDMISGISASMTDSNGQVFGAGSVEYLMGAEYTDGIAQMLIQDKLASGEFEEAVYMSAVESDWLDGRSIGNFKGEDKVYLAPIEITTAHEYNGVHKSITYELRDVYCKFVIANESNIIMTVQTEQALVEEVSRNEIKIA